MAKRFKLIAKFWCPNCHTKVKDKEPEPMIEECETCEKDRIVFYVECSNCRRSFGLALGEMADE